MTLNFYNLVQNLDENEIKSLHHELISKKLYDNLVDISNINGDINKIKKIIPIALQRLDYDDIKKIAPESIKRAVSSHIESESITPEISESPDEPQHEKMYIDSNEYDIDKIKKRLGELTSEKTSTNRILPEYRDEVLALTTKLNKVYGISVRDIAKITNISPPSVSRSVNSFLKTHPYEQHRWIAAAEKKAVVKAEETLTKATGKKADELVETYLSLGQWAIETYALMALSLGMSVRELVELGVDSYDPSIHLEMLEMQREKDELKYYLNSKNMQVKELERIIISIMIKQNPEVADLIYRGVQGR